MNNKYIETLKKIAFGYEYEEVQTQLEETANGQKKKITRIKKHAPPNFQALRFLMNAEAKTSTDVEILEKEMKEFEERIMNNGNKEDKN